MPAFSTGRSGPTPRKVHRRGAGISPLLANVVLHYVLDLWVHQWRKRHARGKVIIVRYADDFVMGFQYETDARRMAKALDERLAQFGLTLNASVSAQIRPLVGG